MTESLTGWGRTSPSHARVARPADVAALRTELSSVGVRGLITRGLGRSYGDPAQNAGGTVLDLTGWDAILGIDAEAPAVRVRAGASLDQLMRTLLPRGLWLPVVPGTRHVTVGGAIAADVHGKNHHVDGSFGNHVISLDLMLATGDIVTLEPGGDDPALFWATVGGMGLTGVVLEATIRLKRVETAYFVVDTERAPDLPTVLERLKQDDSDYQYSVAWFDTATNGRSLGRSIITRGNSATLDDLKPANREGALSLAAPQIGRIPLKPPISMVNRVTARAFNALWYARAPGNEVGAIQGLAEFFHPLDLVGDWNRLYGPKGFCQYQFVMPDGEEAAFAAAVEHIANSVHVSSLNVLKRFGPANASPLSFPIPGWTAAVDLPVRAGLNGLLSHLDEIVVAAGGRLYLAKDSRTTTSTIRRMYPRLNDFLAVRRRVDPHGVFCSDLSRRLDL